MEKSVMGRVRVQTARIDDIVCVCYVARITKD